MSTRSGSLGRRLERVRERSFLGRKDELHSFRAALHGASGAACVLYLHGPEGTGKSMLLRRFALEARAAGRTVVRVDGRTTPATADAFTRAVRPVTREPGAVLLVDSFEHCRSLEGWLREECLPRLPWGTVAVVASRHEPDPHWPADPGWTGLLRVLPLGGLSKPDAAAFLRQRGVLPHLHDALLEFTEGHPLALALAAEAAVRTETGGGADCADPALGQDAVATLLRRLVGTPPDEAHQAALDVCAQARVTSVALLRAVLGDQGEDLFLWLRDQPFVQTTRLGVAPHAVVREALRADLRWRDPAGFAELHRRIRGHLLERTRLGPASRVLETVGDLRFLHRSGRFLADAHGRPSGGRAEELPRAVGHEATLIRRIRRQEGPESARIAAHWLREQPENVHLRRLGPGEEDVGGSAWLRLMPFEGEAEDPVVAAAWAHTRKHGPVRAGEHIALARFHVGEYGDHRPSPVMDASLGRMVGEIIRDDRLAWAFAVLRDDGFWDSHLRHHAMEPTAGTVTVDGHRHRLFACDRRALPAVLGGAANAPLLTGAAPGPARSGKDPCTAAEILVLGEEEFAVAVKAALRALRRPRELVLNPLQRSRLVLAHGMGLKDVVTSAIGSLPLERGGDKGYRAATAAYVEGASTQAAAARRLGLPLSTYRRHLAWATRRITRIMWEHELSGTPLLSPADRPRR
ncbi:AAA family ATPase [Streptomyces diastaticus]|uniref:AAA family ATPase n=1 Tax=Streptomyces diastaticus TaxID=1956 RepID=UPI0013B61027|nr:AAA family ATPase [Streptomyces sp. BRB081]MBL3803611.1 ATP-binding protein [Streptomyces sp. BRB081]NEE54182.1 ATP-binding protein [Streptomyces sp. SID8455]